MRAYGPKRCVLWGSLMLFTLGAVGCRDHTPQTLGQRCGGDHGACAKGLRCSDKQKRCYLPVKCDLLEKRLKACIGDLISLYAPKSATLPPAQRVKLLDTLAEKLQTELVKHCRFDAATYRDKHGLTPPKTKSRGEDPQAEAVNACLEKPQCNAFSRCVLELARLIGPKRPRPDAPTPFPPKPMTPPMTPPMALPMAPGMDATAPPPAETPVPKTTPAMDTAVDAPKSMAPAGHITPAMPAGPRPTSRPR